MGLKAAQEVRPSGGVIFTPAVVTFRSARGTLTLKTPSFSSILPLAPVSCSIFAVSSLASAAEALEMQKATDRAMTAAVFILAPLRGFVLPPMPRRAYAQLQLMQSLQ